MIKEESDFHDLESVVQQVEQNLELMTVRRGSALGVGRGQEAAAKENLLLLPESTAGP